jgi:hypothetical protein
MLVLHLKADNGPRREVPNKGQIIRVQRPPETIGRLQTDRSLQGKRMASLPVETINNLLQIHGVHRLRLYSPEILLKIKPTSLAAQDIQVSLARPPNKDPLQGILSRGFQVFTFHPRLPQTDKSQCPITLATINRLNSLEHRAVVRVLKTDLQNLRNRNHIHNISNNNLPSPPIMVLLRLREVFKVLLRFILRLR